MLVTVSNITQYLFPDEADVVVVSGQKAQRSPQGTKFLECIAVGLSLNE